MKKKVCVGSLNACIRRNLDAHRLKKYFELNNYEIVERPEDADYTFVFTCAFSDYAADPNIEEIARLARSHSELFVCGCLPAIDSEKLRKVFSGNTIITSELYKIDEFFPGNRVKFSEIGDVNDELKNYLFLDRNKNITISYLNNAGRFGAEKILRIAEGCLGNCAYCAIPKATGRLRSKGVQECLREYRDLLANEAESIVIEAEDTGAYGVDLRSSFVDLLRGFLLSNREYGRTPTLFLKSFHPVWLVKYYDNLSSMLGEANVRRIACPIQSGSKRILRLMNRYGNLGLIENRLSGLKKEHPDIHIATDIIVGFPSETEEDFLESVALCKRIGFDSVEMYAYSDKRGTVAYDMPNKVPKETLFKRLEMANKEFETQAIDVITYA